MLNITGKDKTNYIKKILIMAGQDCIKEGQGNANNSQRKYTR